ncbi:hypothetical protein SAMN04489726_2380 [Allokutzneria albata]|uniref:Uncharacterized protein n=1 Tax=Allokutzneria albata TaxID=211114 RepID=A0A1G9UFQ1_ALLAB|nr:hypothetical protein SAMN04489726_2380 [Allokutzneria albata]
MPLTTGLVTAVWLLSCEFRFVREGWQAAAGTTRLEEKTSRAPRFIPRTPFEITDTSHRQITTILATVTCA